ncbi:MAG: cation diffusion facilitator family transporter [Clostridiales bacterium]|nr:cation diffusion facilitator family transporter [Clostridiales bacterium]MDD7432766.1 cation diffusion facilitator family transporter [Clostridiales bacterium]MDY3061368.1 cation diffusion facilitator family transporter [Eubacteriales bacterium]
MKNKLHRFFYKPPFAVPLVQFALRKEVKRSFDTARVLILQMSGVLGLILNLILSTVKILAGSLFNSLALIADGVNNLSDALVSFVTIVGIRWSAKAPDKEHPYGHGRIEYLLSAAISFLIFFAGLSVFRAGFEKVRTGAEGDQLSGLVLIFMLLSILVKLWLFFFYRFLGESLRSELLISNSRDSLSDVFASSAILLGLGITALGGPNSDGWLSLAVSLLIFREGWEVLKNTIDKLLGGRPSPQQVVRIREFLNGRPEILGFHDLMIHDYGPGRIFVTVDAVVDGRKDLLTLHREIDQTEEEARDKLKLRLTIHMEPVLEDDPIINGILPVFESKLAELSPAFSYHDFDLMGEDHHIIRFDLLIPEEEERSDEKLIAQLRQNLEKDLPGYHLDVRIKRNLLGI